MAQEANSVSKRLPLASSPENRDETNTKDARIINAFVERTEAGDYQVYKRPGLTASTTKSGNGRGLFNWKGDQYAIFGTTLYKNGTNLGTVDGTSFYTFSSSLGGTPRLFFHNNAKGYTYDGTTLAQVTDANYPATTVPGSVYLDATMYVMDSTATIHGSALNDPTTWQALNTIVAQIEPDGGIALAKQLVYVVAFKQWTTEFFYDAANATGSPLSPVQGAKINFGCANANTVQDIDGILLYLGINRTGSLSVLTIDLLKPTIVSTKAVERLLNNIDITVMYSWQYKADGHRLYGLTSKNSNLTLVYDLNEKMWAQWTDSSGNYFPIVASTYNSSLQRFFQGETSGLIYTADNTFYTDNGAIIPVDIYTPIFDGGTRARKIIKQLELVADKISGGIVSLRHSDDDYQTWSQFRQLDLSNNRPVMWNCGTFRRRAYHLRHQAATGLRVQAIEARFLEGSI